MLLINQEPRQSIFHVLSCDQLRGALLINLDLTHAHQSSFIHNCVAKFFITKYVWVYKGDLQKNRGRVNV